MMDERLKKYEPFFGKWKVSRELGRGAFGQVYEIYWEDDLGSRSRSALKVIHIPTDEALRIQMEEQPSVEAVRNYFLKQVEKIKDEIRILQRCKGHSNIVSYEDHMIKESSDGIGWDILIRMELLYPLNPYFARKEATQYDIIRMWLDISNALIYCEEQNIIHRDIKPANILLSSGGRYKLSDFGVARKSMQATDASTRVGTERYMAPEVFRNQKYDKRADYYSLGCVIYYFLNKKRHVFLPPYPQEVDAEDNERAERRRISGERIPGIKGVSKEINDILIKSMAYRPANRYKSARDLYKAIRNLLEKQGDELKQRYLNEDMSGSFSTLSLGSTKGGEKNYRASLAAVLAGVFLTAGIGGIIFGVVSKRNQKLTLVMDSKVNDQGVLQAQGTELCLRGRSRTDSRLVLHVNMREETILSDGSWEYRLPLDALEDQADNKIYISYEDGSETSESLEFYADLSGGAPQPQTEPAPEEETQPEPTGAQAAEPTPTPAPTPTPEPTATPTPEP
ncbi:MAG: protein kinase, partial [Eubacteriales bacterium]|nr:protein kinase [Eubacteriales bacterium]